MDYRPPIPAEIREHYVDDWLYLGLISMKAGQVGEQHVHEWDHPTIVCGGTVRLYEDGLYKGTYTGFTYVSVKAGHKHWFEAETDVMLICAHNLRGRGYPALKEI